ncbi:hypothetical protein M9H77_31539 [Catharanthus roseus]|uniref:Uncharacterized protein n=1 Tax=Catharanthus roseus TaxID=4058 RepID=A0ACC0A1N2_CATRO|nr:hypothetical protein M9H77_31539 [Catharanthus roseus]
MLCTQDSSNTSSSAPNISQESKRAYSLPPNITGGAIQAAGSVEEAIKGAIDDNGCEVGTEDEPGASELADTYVCVVGAEDELGASKLAESTDPVVRESVDPFV